MKPEFESILRRDSHALKVKNDAKHVGLSTPPGNKEPRFKEGDTVESNGFGSVKAGYGGEVTEVYSENGFFRYVVATVNLYYGKPLHKRRRSLNITFRGCDLK
jgi:hypothetical protein